MTGRSTGAANAEAQRHPGTAGNPQRVTGHTATAADRLDQEGIRPRPLGFDMPVRCQADLAPMAAAAATATDADRAGISATAGTDRDRAAAGATTAAHRLDQNGIGLAARCEDGGSHTRNGFRTALTHVDADIAAASARATAATQAEGQRCIRAHAGPGEGITAIAAAAADGLGNQPARTGPEGDELAVLVDPNLSAGAATAAAAPEGQAERSADADGTIAGAATTTDGLREQGVRSVTKRPDIPARGRRNQATIASRSTGPAEGQRRTEGNARGQGHIDGHGEPPAATTAAHGLGEDRAGVGAMGQDVAG